MELKSFLLARRKQVIIAGAVVVVILVGSITGAVAYNGEQDRLATIAADEVAQAALDTHQAMLAKELADTRSEGSAVLDTALTRQETSAAFAEPATLELLAEAITQLETDLDSDDAAKIRASLESVRELFGDLGTADDAQDRKYLTARKAAGKPVDDAETTIRIGRGVCDKLHPYYAPDPAKAVMNFVENRSSLDVDAITFYCPEYSPAVAAASTAFRDGNHIVAAAASPMGTYGSDIQQGTYRTQLKTSNCYWERTNGGGGTIANDFVSFAGDGIAVTVYTGEGFVTEGCGTWTLQ